MRQLIHTLVSALAISSAACSEDAGADDEPANGSQEPLTGCDAISLPTAEDGIQLQMPLRVEAASEAEYCQLVLVDQPLNLNWSEGLFTHGSHHGVVHKTAYRGEIPRTTITGQTMQNADEPHRCLTPPALWDTEGVLAGGRSVEGSEAADGLPKGALPNDVAYRIEAGDVLLVNFHMINTTDHDLDSCYKVNLHGIPDQQVTEEAGTFFFYNPTITVPANGTSSARMACQVSQDITVLSSVSHMHARGAGYAASLWDGRPTDPQAKVLRELYTTTEWDEPAPRWFAPSLELTNGQWIDYTCEYENPEARNVSQGFASTDEMCMFVGVYYPKNLALEQCAGERLIFGDGTRTGQEVVDCVQELVSPHLFGSFDNAARHATQACFTEACPAIAEPMTRYFVCGFGSGCEAQAAELAAATCD
jgi:hypothetical protein